MRALFAALYRADPLWLALLGTLVYANSVDNPFVFDDHIMIAENLTIRQLWPPAWLDLRPDIPLSSRPLVRLSLTLNYAVDGLNPATFRVVNIGVHLLAGLTLRGVLRRTFDRFCGGSIPHTSG